MPPIGFLEAVIQTTALSGTVRRAALAARPQQQGLDAFFIERLVHAGSIVLAAESRETTELRITQALIEPKA
jgi:hypothetical protein